jgi:8-oxo-dGTP pyrophosphatase MutT (NUDIX family)
MQALTFDHDKPHLKVQVWIYVFPNPASRKRFRVLVLKTRKDRGGFWQPVTGSVEKGERLLDAALREAQEETSLTFCNRLRRVGEKFHFHSRWGGWCEEQTFLVEAKLTKNGSLPEVKLDPREHTEYEWLSPTTAAKKLAFSSNRRLLRAVCERLRKGK